MADLASLYRPLTFDAVTGRDLIVNTLQSALRQNRLSSFLILHGHYGSGKTTIALLLAAALNCERGGIDAPVPEPCGECNSCKSILMGADQRTSLDVISINAASNTGVDAMRQLMDRLHQVPSGFARVVIVDEAHRLSSAAQDSLLTTLEHPPERTYFIFCTTEPKKLRETILSRGERYEFSPLDLEDIKVNLRSIAASEGISLPDVALQEIATLSDGSLRTAQKLLGQLAVSGDSITVERVRDTVGYLPIASLSVLVSAIEAGEADVVFSYTMQLLSDPQLVLSDLLSVYERILCSAINPDSYDIDQLPPLDPKHVCERIASLSDLDLPLSTQPALTLRSRLVSMALSAKPAVWGGWVELIRSIHRSGKHGVIASIAAYGLSADFKGRLVTLPGVEVPEEARTKLLDLLQAQADALDMEITFHYD